MPIISGGGGSSAPTGTAGGDLSGTYPDPSVAAVQGITFTGTPSSGSVPIASSAAAASWGTLAGGNVGSGGAGSALVLKADGAGGSAFARHGWGLLANSTAGVGGAASFDLQSIDQNYIGLHLSGSVRCDNPAQESCNLLFNNDTGANYDYETAGGTGGLATNAESLSQTAGFVIIMPTSGDGAGAVATFDMFIPNYTGTTFWKAAYVIGGVHGTSMQVRTIYNQWRSTAAISRITLVPSAGNFVQGSHVTLWGVT